MNKNKGVMAAKIFLGVLSGIVILIGLILTIWAFKAVLRGYEKVEFTVTDCEVTDVQEKKVRKKRNGKYRYEREYVKEYEIAYEYDFEGETYTYETSKTFRTSDENRELCDVGDIEKYYINPDEPENTSEFVDAKATFVGPILLVVGIVIGVMAIVITVIDLSNRKKLAGQ